MTPSSQTTGHFGSHRFLSGMQLLALAPCLLASIAVVSCGSSVRRPQTTIPAVVDGPQNLVSPSEIAQAGSSSTAQGTLMRWFQAIQYRDYSTALELTTSRVRKLVGVGPVRNAISVVGAALGKPLITGTVVHASGLVSVHMLVLGFSPNSSKPVEETPVTIPLVKTAASWQVDDVTYLLEDTKAIEALNRPHKPIP